jgi:hypothetical protein
MKTRTLALSVVSILTGIVAMTAGAQASNKSITRTAAVQYNNGQKLRVVYSNIDFSTDSHKMTRPYAPWAKSFGKHVAYAADAMNPQDLAQVRTILVVGDITDARSNKRAGFSCSKCANSVLVLSMNDFTKSDPKQLRSKIQSAIFSASKYSAKIVNSSRESLCAVIDESAFGTDESGAGGAAPVDPAGGGTSTDQTANPFDVKPDAAPGNTAGPSDGKAPGKGKENSGA